MKKANEMNVVERVKAPTPPFWKKVRKWALVVVAVAGTLAAPPLGIVAAGYVAAGAAAIAAGAQVAVDDEKVKE